ncbi:MAG: A/G-specific adenine glycosylase [Betaproteobacteria bacterium]|nr:A/G-specific adenine glycosylase [Betaproteobacteria bacterium]
MPEALKPSESFAKRLVAWQQVHGRHDLPWQRSRDPYRVWLSEIMLQQTQVSTVLGYYERFLQAFPTVADLANASLDQVLGLWSGLGYYSRAKHLHRCAQMVAASGGVFPQAVSDLRRLPGIGPSTAAAIASLCFEQREAILDGNVKRVLTRFHGFDKDLSRRTHAQALWQIAQDSLPAQGHDMPAYTQGLMDLGATLCTRSKPDCPRCPMKADCVALSQQRPTHYPVIARQRKRSAQSLWLLCAVTTQAEVWLQQRPDKGVWASLYTQPLFDSEDALLASLPGKLKAHLQAGPAFVHVLTHKDLHLHPMHLALNQPVDLGQGSWFSATIWPSMGLPTPVRKLLQRSPLDCPE